MLRRSRPCCSSAGLFTTIAAIFIGDHTGDCPSPIVNKSLWWSECYKLTGSNDVAVRALLHGLTRGSVPQAALAVLPLLVAARCRITRRALALATLAVTVTNHCMLAWLAGLLFVGTSGDALGILLLVAVVGVYVFPAAVFALFFFVALVLGGELVE
ncbi:hypothetical protein C2845_PM09G13410 [Panicum miliaceum]|uniref:Uncharacterized protein n=1 Tax=Panicum miliaceum TaxID=4540 RepID=A0A3L6S294_PANMI|nr:hypothetical protein C2845_PM09G13410 [Panicum miliaceum]